MRRKKLITLSKDYGQGITPTQYATSLDHDFMHPRLKRDGEVRDTAIRDFLRTEWGIVDRKDQTRILTRLRMRSDWKRSKRKVWTLAPDGYSPASAFHR